MSLHDFFDDLRTDAVSRMNRLDREKGTRMQTKIPPHVVHRIAEHVLHVHGTVVDEHDLELYLTQGLVGGLKSTGCGPDEFQTIEAERRTYGV